MIKAYFFLMLCVTGQHDVTVADAAETARRTFLEVESTSITYHSSPHHFTSSSSAAAPAAAAGTLQSRSDELCDRGPSQEQLPSR